MAFEKRSGAYSHRISHDRINDLRHLLATEEGRREYLANVAARVSETLTDTMIVDFAPEARHSNPTYTRSEEDDE